MTNSRLKKKPSQAKSISDRRYISGLDKRAVLDPDWLMYIHDSKLDVFRDFALSNEGEESITQAKSCQDKGILARFWCRVLRLFKVGLVLFFVLPLQAQTQTDTVWIFNNEIRDYKLPSNQAKPDTVWIINNKMRDYKLPSNQAKPDTVWIINNEIRDDKPPYRENKTGVSAFGASIGAGLGVADKLLGLFSDTSCDEIKTIKAQMKSISYVRKFRKEMATLNKKFANEDIDPLVYFYSRAVAMQMSINDVDQLETRSQTLARKRNRILAKSKK